MSMWGREARSEADFCVVFWGNTINLSRPVTEIGA